MDDTQFRLAIAGQASRLSAPKRSCWISAAARIDEVNGSEQCREAAGRLREFFLKRGVTLTD